MFWPHYGKIKKKLKAKRTVETAVFLERLYQRKETIYCLLFNFLRVSLLEIKRIGQAFIIAKDSLCATRNKIQVYLFLEIVRVKVIRTDFSSCISCAF